MKEENLDGIIVIEDDYEIDHEKKE